MLSKYIFVYLCCCVYSVLSISSFIDKGQRAELFELLDNEIPIVKINMPNEDFVDLNEIASYPNTMAYQFYNFSSLVPKVIKKYLVELQKINFIETYPGYDFNEILPQLQVGEDGFAKFDIEQIISGFDSNPKHYGEGNPEKFYKHILGSNENFNINEITDTLKEMKMDDSKNNEDIKKIIENINEYIEISMNELNNDDYIILLFSEIKEVVLKICKLFKKINFKKYFPGNNYDEMFPLLKIGEDGYAKFDIEEVLSGYDFDPEHYKQYICDNVSFYVILGLVLDSNKEFTSTINTFSAEVNPEFQAEIEYMLIDIINEQVSLKNSNDKENKSKIIENKLNNIISNDHLNKSEVNKKYYDGYLTEFKTKNATMTFELNGEKKLFKKVTLSLSGEYSREFPRPNYNVKIRGNQELYGRSQFKFRSDSIEPTYLRSKLVADIHNRLGLKSISANYIQLYINDEYMGLYIITESLKLSWIEKNYGEKDSSNLYKCKGLNKFSPDFMYGCVNENDEVTDHSEWIKFLTTVENATSPSDLEDIFEIDHFLYEMAIEYLVCGWDHINNGHNYILYRQPNGKWIYLSHDFDLDIGIPRNSIKEYYNAPIEDFFNESMNLVKILVLTDPSRFIEILKDVVNKTFNPSTLYPHIDELKQFIKPYVELDKIPDSNGNYPGAINKVKEDIYKKFYTMEQWEAYSEFTTGLTDRLSYGLKYWILMKYRNVCQTYNMECDPIYMDENYEFYVNKEVEFLQYENVDDDDDYDDSTLSYPLELPTAIGHEGKQIISLLYSESETEYEVDEPTPFTDDESSYEEEEEEEIEITDSVESSLLSFTTTVPTSTKITITKTKTKVNYYTNVTN